MARNKQQFGISISRELADRIYADCSGPNRIGNSPSEVIEKRLSQAYNLHVEETPKYETEKKGQI